MNAGSPIHLCTDRGSALCGVAEPRCLTSAEKAVTCAECRAFIALKAIERNIVEGRLAATIARLAARSR